jgi:glycosyltransferase involved in cell wall biosynthesis
MKLTVIIPTFNRCDMLFSSVSSVCGIKHRPLEVIVVDDGSTDGTADRSEEIKAICDASGVNLLFIRQNNAGAAAARNTGLAHSTGDLVQWVDADDTVKASGLAPLVKELCAHPDLAVAYGLVDVVDASGVRESVMGKAPSHGESDLFDLLWHTMGAVYRKASLPGHLRWNPRIVLGDDWDFSCRIRIAGLPYKFVDTIVGNYVKHDLGSLTIKGHNEAKCFGVIEAVLSIRAALLESCKLSPYLQQRCYNRALVHAVELSTNRSPLAKQAYAICRDIGSPSRALSLLAVVLSVVPIKALHRLLFRILRSK